MANNRELSQFANVVGYSGGNIGIGTDNPGTQVHIEAAEPFVRLENTHSGSKRLDLRVEEDDNHAYISAPQSGQNLNLYGRSAFTIATNSETTERLRVTSTGVKQVLNGNLNIQSTYIDFSGDQSSTPQTAVALYRPADGTFAISTQNTERLRITSAGLAGIGTNNPSGKLNIAGSDSQLLNLIQDSGDLQIRLNDRGVGSAYIKVRDNTLGSLSFDTGGSERLRIRGEGPHLLLGTGGDTTYNEITESSSNAGLVIGSSSMGNGGIVIRNSTSGTGRIYFADNSGSDPGRQRGQINYYHNGDYMMFATAGSERVRIHAGGTLSVSTGIELGSGLDGTSANTLDDYEEGSFTVSFVSGLTSDTYANTGGHYTKIGNFVTFTIRIAGAGTNSGSEQVKVGNLPFLASSSAREGGAWFNYRHDLDTGGGPFMHISSGGDDILWYGNAGAAWVGSDGDGLNNNTFHIQGFYYTDS